MRAVNLIPAEQRGGGTPGPARSEGAAYAVLGLLGGLAVLAVLYGSAQRQIANRRAQSDLEQRAVAALQAGREDLAAQAAEAEGYAVGEVRSVNGVWHLRIEK